MIVAPFHVRVIDLGIVPAGRDLRRCLCLLQFRYFAIGRFHGRFYDWSGGRWKIDRAGRMTAFCGKIRLAFII